jgi:YD repeat-containing protein
VVPPNNSYTYDLNNNLTKVNDASSNVRNFTYDGMNRRLTAEDLHASGDSTYGGNHPYLALVIPTS